MSSPTSGSNSEAPTKKRLRGDLWVEAMKSAPTSAGTVPGELDSDWPNGTGSLRSQEIVEAMCEETSATHRYPQKAHNLSFSANGTAPSSIARDEGAFRMPAMYFRTPASVDGIKPMAAPLTKVCRRIFNSENLCRNASPNHWIAGRLRKSIRHDGSSSGRHGSYCCT